LCAVLFECCVVFCVMCIFVCCLIVVPLSPGKAPFAVQLNNNNNNNNNVFLTAELVGGKWSVSRPDRFIPHEKAPWYLLDRKLSGPRNLSRRREEEKKSCSYRDSNSDYITNLQMEPKFAIALTFANIKLLIYLGVRGFRKMY
jgi:hypothetical protein